MFNSDEARERLDELVANALNDKEFIELFKNFEVRSPEGADAALYWQGST